MMKNRWIPAGVVTQIARNAARSSPPTNVATCWAAPQLVGPVTRAFTTATMGATANAEFGTLTAKTTNRISTTAEQPLQNLLLITYATFQTARARVS